MRDETPADLLHWPLDRFIEYARNPRRNDHAVEKIAAAIHEFGFRIPILAKSDGLVVDGHLRLKAARKLGLATVPVLLADDLTETQIKAFRLSVNRMAELAEWDSELLSLELQDLTALDYNLELLGWDGEELARLLDGDGLSGDGGGDGEADDDNYSRKIEAPIYEITGDCPAVPELLNRSKADALIAEIDRATLPEEVADFLRHAAERHVVFNFRNIAEYYAHADAEVQNLMERSALVIIDFNRAIEDGFVKLTSAVADQYTQDYPDA